MNKEFNNNFVLRLVDIILLFVYGFTFFIWAFDERMAMAYFSFLLVGSLWLMYNNYLQRTNHSSIAASNKLNGGTKNNGINN